MLLTEEQESRFIDAMFGFAGLSMCLTVLAWLPIAIG